MSCSAVGKLSPASSSLWVLCAVRTGGSYRPVCVCLFVAPRENSSFLAWKSEVLMMIFLMVVLTLNCYRRAIVVVDMAFTHRLTALLTCVKCLLVCYLVCRYLLDVMYDVFVC